MGGRRTTVISGVRLDRRPSPRRSHVRRSRRRGHAIRTDNDLFTTFTRTNSFGLRIQGVVQDAAGQSYRLDAEIHDLIFPDLTFKRVVQNVHLHPVGGP